MFSAVFGLIENSKLGVGYKYTQADSRNPAVLSSDCFIIRFCAVVLSIFALGGTVADAQKLSNVRNAGEQINSNYDELSPLIAPDGKTLYFSRRNHPQNTYFKRNDNNTDIWYSVYDTILGTWSDAAHMPSPFNKRLYNSVESVSPDGNILYIRGAYVKGKYQGNGISYTYKTTTGWSLPRQMEIRRFNKLNKGSTTNFFVSSDGKKLFVSFSRVENSKINDLYYCYLRKDSLWSRPRKMNTPVNSREFSEEAPFLASDGQTLYFSSNREGGYGKNDIWVSRRVDKSWLKWSKPVLLDSPINTHNWEKYYSVDAKGDMAYFVSNNGTENNNSDIVKIYLKEEFRPNPVALLNAHLVEYKTGKPLEALVRFFDAQTKLETSVTRTAPEDGHFKMVLPLGRNYNVTANIEGYLPVLEQVDLISKFDYIEINRTIPAVPFGSIRGIEDTPEKMVKALKGANLTYFESDSSLLKLELTSGAVYDLLPINNGYLAVLRSLDPSSNSIEKALVDKSLNVFPVDVFKDLSQDEQALIQKEQPLQSEELSEDTILVLLPSKKNIIIMPSLDGGYATRANSEISSGLIANIPEDVFDKIYHIPLTEIEGLSPIEKLQLANKTIVLANNRTDTTFMVSFPSGKRYFITPNANGYTAVLDEPIVADNETDWDLLKEEEERKMIRVGNTVKIENLFFDFAKASIQQESYASLDNLVRIMKANPKLEILISGHTDNIGSMETNIKLSRERAAAVRQYLLSKHINPYRIIYQGSGALFPVVNDDSELSRQMNRRVEFTVLRNN